MEKKNTILVAVCGVILVAFLAVATIKISVVAASIAVGFMF